MLNHCLLYGYSQKFFLLWYGKIYHISIMSTKKREKVIAAARAEIGTKENPPNSNKNKYGEWYGLNGYAWCAMFVSWCFNKAGVALGRVDDDKGYRYCPSAYQFWKRTNQITKNPQPGDIVLFDWEGDGKCDHTGIFVKDNGDKKTFTAIEGNTSFTNNSNGGEVMERKRHYALVKAFVSPNAYAKEPALEAPVEYQEGDNGAGILEFQKKLKDLGYSLVADGEFGPETKKVVKAFQKDQLQPETGKVSAQLIGMMDELIRQKNAPETMLTSGSYLNPGSSGMAVRLLQEALNVAAASAKIIADGMYGPATKKAVMDYQRSKGLVVDGIAGPETLKKLKLVL
jgi:peptidoglycan hydrolase-like protein with peptidoglycan-binding domain